MSNNLVSNVTKKVLRAFMRGFEANTVLLKTVDTQMFSGEFNPSSGSTVDIKRPHQYLSQETADGDISGGTDNSIISGKATATVQNYVTGSDSLVQQGRGSRTRSAAKDSCACS